VNTSPPLVDDMSAAPSFPFTALVGQPRLQLALLLAAIDPTLGGVLVSGPRGTAKSTAARALAQLLPDAPFVTLPLSATLEQVVGTLDVEGALRDGSVRLAPGLLARAHGGVLYVDEVNLLSDALVDAMLDVAASGVNIVERDGVSHRHAARFVLVGTMNPEEGELRPQLLDRFGLFVALDNPSDPSARAAIVRARLAYEADPAAFARQHADQQATWRQRLQRARALLPELSWSDEVFQVAATLAHRAQVDGVRGDLVLLKASRAHAAWLGRECITPEDVHAVADMALAHRRSASSPAPAPQPVTNAARVWGGAPETVTGSVGDAARASEEGAVAADGHDGWGALPPQPVDMMGSAAWKGWPIKKA
jgi:magnesium chelatase subunit I